MTSRKHPRQESEDSQPPAAKRAKTECKNINVQDLVKTLQTRGAVCVPMAWATPSKISEMMAEFDATVAAFPEFKQDLPRTYTFPVKDTANEAALAWLDKYLAFKAAFEGGCAVESAAKAEEYIKENAELAETFSRRRREGDLSPTSTNAVATQWVGGGFGALGNPSSQHNMFVRRIRQWVMNSLMPLFSAFVQDLPEGDWKLEKTFDRMLIRSIDQTPTAESLHRDECPKAAPSDVLFGGWFNLTGTDQSFTFVPGSHRASADGKAEGKATGFSKIIKGSSEYKTLLAGLETITVRPGEVLVFFEHVAHIVAPTPTSRKMRRAFLGWRLTQASQPLVSNVHELISKQAVVPLKSAQIPVMYPRMWRATELPRLQVWSTTMFDPRLLETVTVASGKSKGREFRIVPSVLKSLAEYQEKFPDKQWKQPDYSADELAIYSPGNRWNLLVPGSTTEFEFVKL